MSKHELEVRLKQVREKKAALEAQLREYLKQKKREREQAARQRAEREEAERSRGPVLKYLKKLIGLLSLLTGLDIVDGSVEFVGAAYKSSIDRTLLLTTQEGIEQLELEEAEILDALEKLNKEIEKPEVKEDPDIQARNEIFERMASRKKERVQRILEVTSGKSPEDWTPDDKENVARIKNAYDQADERDMERLEKLL